MQDNIKDIKNWCDRTGSSINPGKVLVIWCSLNAKINIELPQIKFDEEIIQRNDTIKYLGTTFDSKLSFHSHF